MRGRTTKLAAVTAAAALVLAACGDDGNDEAESPATTEAEAPAEPGTIVDVAVEAGIFTTLVAAVEAAGLVDTLSSEGPFTVFAPTDEAFVAALEALDLTAEELLGDTELLTDVLTYHVLEGEVDAATAISLDGQSAATVNGAEIAISVVDGNVMINDATVTQPDVEASNGIIHIIDAVLLPPADEMAEEEAEGEADDEEMAEEEAMDEEMTEDPTIVDVAVEAGIFTTLVAAVDAAGLVDTLSSEGPFTVFAPTDEAFVAALQALDITPEELLGDTELLTSVLLYHVVEGAVDAETAISLDGQSAATLNGAEIAISVVDGSVMINDATVTEPDVMAANGIIHIIDSVLLPPADEMADEEALGTIADIVAGNEDFSILLAAVEAAGLTEALAGEGPLTVFAPTDEAFEAALAALELTAEELLGDTELLTSVLLYHVVEGAVDAETAISLDGQSAATLNGAEIAISVVDGSVMINDATVTEPDVMAANGIIHIIDSVLLPPSDG